ncbi:MAG: CYTH domain-containing protein [Lachnospiraceae bacterium]
MEIERKFLIKALPKDYLTYPFHQISQAYLCTSPVVRIRQSDQDFILTYKGGGMLSREEYNLPLTETAFLHLLKKADGRIITKKRYLIPYLEKYIIELDLFENELAPLICAEVEFASEAEALAFIPPDWFGEDVTFLEEYKNSYLSRNIQKNGCD